MSRVADALQKSRSGDRSAMALDETARHRNEVPGTLKQADAVVAFSLESAPVVNPAHRRPRDRDARLERHLAALVERVFLPISGEPIRSVAFAATGTEANCGVLAATAAEMVAERTSGRVCVIDANFRTPSLHVHFGVPNVHGLADALASDQPIVESARRVQHNLWVVTAGVAAKEPSWFASAPARLQMTQLLDQFDYVLVNVEPILAAGNVPVVMRLVSHLIAVITADSTRREAARRALETLTDAGVTVIGAVLMNRQFPMPAALSRLV